MTYFLITGGEDGVQVCSYESEEELQEELAECEDARFIKLADFDRDSDEWGTFVLIRGEVVVPKAKEVVKAWDFDE